MLTTHLDLLHNSPLRSYLSSFADIIPNHIPNSFPYIINLYLSILSLDHVSERPAQRADCSDMRER